MTKVMNYFKKNFGLVIGLIAFALVLGGCVFKKDFVRYKKVAQKQAKGIQVQQTKTSKKQVNRIRRLEKSLRWYKKQQRLQRKKDNARALGSFLYVARLQKYQDHALRYMARNLQQLAQFSSYIHERVFKLAESTYGDGAYFFMGMGHYRANNGRMALLMFNKSIFRLEHRMKRRKAKCGKKACKLYLADSLYFRAIIYSVNMMTKKAMKDLHRLDKLKLLKKYKKFWEDPRFEKLFGLPAWLKLVKKYKKKK